MLAKSILVEYSSLTQIQIYFGLRGALSISVYLPIVYQFFFCTKMRKRVLVLFLLVSFVFLTLI